MKRILCMLGASLLALSALTACGTTHDAEKARFEAIKASHELDLKREERLMEQEARADAAVIQMAGSDAGSRATVQNFFMMKGIVSVVRKDNGSSSTGGAQAALYQATPDKTLQWASVLSAPLSNVAGAYFNYKLGMQQSNNNVLNNQSNNNMLGGIVNSSYLTLGGISEAGINKPVFAVTPE